MFENSFSGWAGQSMITPAYNTYYQNTMGPYNYMGGNGMFGNYYSQFPYNGRYSAMPTTTIDDYLVPGESRIAVNYEPAAPHESVGINMNSLIDQQAPIPDSQKQQIPTIEPQFNSLIGQQPNYMAQQKFAIQPVPVDLDRSMLPKPVEVSSMVEDATSHLSKAQPTEHTVGRKLNNWFTRILEQRGNDYITSGKLSVDEVSKNAERILDDMISGKVDYTTQGSIIISPVVIDTLINYCANKLAINRAIQFALGYVYNDYTEKSTISDPYRQQTLNAIDDAMSRNIAQAIAIVNQDIGIYDILYKKLTFVEATKNASSLFSLTNELNNYKKQIKKRY